jgi:four helix bundle protein
MKENIIQNKTFDFAVCIIKLYKYLIDEKKEFVLSKQLLRAGISVGANKEEAIGGYTKKDFSAKISIVYKEERESHYWLRLLKETDFLIQAKFDSLINSCEEILKILFTIIKSSTKK